MIRENASAILQVLAEFKTEDGKQIGANYYISRKGIEHMLKERGWPELEPVDMNDAINTLERMGYIKVMRSMGTSPYHFSGVSLLTEGRLAYEDAIFGQKRILLAVQV